MNPTLLIEIGVEELPPHAMRPLADAFAQGLSQALGDAGLAHGKVLRFATPRRLAVALHDMPSGTEAVAVEKSGPTVAIAFDDAGRPTPAAEGFARSVGVPVDELSREDSDKGERLVYRGKAPGQPLAELLQSAVDGVLRGLPIPKRMRWGDSQAAFVRPVHWLVALHGDGVVDLTVFGHVADRLTYGHRFHHAGPIALDNAEAYEAALLEPGHVLVDPDARKARVKAVVESAATSLNGRALIDDGLLEEVTALVEWPAGIAGRFDTRFLALPREVLVATLEGHQRYFPVADDDGELVAGFVTVANIESRDPAQVVAGNERVVRPRLSDALFFWEQDRRHGLDTRRDGLARVSFQQALGSLADKSARVTRLVKDIAPLTDADPEAGRRAAELAKADLLTEMVGEFPELQGIMGRYYARHDGEAAAVAEAIGEQYAPVGGGAPIAGSPAGRALAIADRLDTLAGIFAAGKRPSGDKDPFGLRRAALGVLRTLIEGDIEADLAALLRRAIVLQPIKTNGDELFDSLWMFHMERLRGYYLDQSYRVEQFDAVAAAGVTDMRDFDRRMRAVASFATLETAPVVCGAHKRIRNILRRNAKDAAADHGFDPSATVEDAERQLAAACEAQTQRVDRALADNAYDKALNGLADLAEPLALFFDQVMVMADDDTLRRNRLALLATLDRLCRRVADISCLSVDSNA